MLKELVHHKNTLFLALTETHLNNDHLNAKIYMENYTIWGLIDIPGVMEEWQTI